MSITSGSPVKLLVTFALPLMLVNLPARLKLPRWTGYVLYPGHLAALIALEYAMGVTVHWEHLANAWQQFIALF